MSHSSDKQGTWQLMMLKRMLLTFYTGVCSPCGDDSPALKSAAEEAACTHFLSAWQRIWGPVYRQTNPPPPLPNKLHAASKVLLGEEDLQGDKQSVTAEPEAKFLLVTRSCLEKCFEVASDAAMQSTKWFQDNRRVNT